MAVLLPYQFKIISKSASLAPGTTILRVQILDAGSTIRRDTEIHVANNITWGELRQVISEQTDRALVTDAGSKKNFLDQLIADGTRFEA